MKTEKIIEKLREHTQDYVAYKIDREFSHAVNEAAERLEQLSTGEQTLDARVAATIFTPTELARMYCIRIKYSEELFQENTRLKAELERLRADKEILQRVYLEAGW